MKPIIIAVAGIVSLAGGAVAGAMLGAAGPHGADMEDAKPMVHAAPSRFDYVKFNSQFVVPLQSDRRVTALVVANLQLEVTEGASEEVLLREPRLRDLFLKILFEMAAEGAFDGDMFAPMVQKELRGRLLAAARNLLGPEVNAVLISDLLKQDR
ncbi:MAG: flagellar basal body-associated FliL family protein [Alphaproteobacteria bacterium]|nr:flagellar basal body-associated FliL family protein [Alphaproteobacteria bacterium]MCB9928754.1 flagellar basal body-associated FliL family protein [Alphaproteobacteria bacterium]